MANVIIVRMMLILLNLLKWKVMHIVYILSESLNKSQVAHSYAL